MRINKFLAQATGMSRRAADAAITDGKVLVNDAPATAGQGITEADSVTFNGATYTLHGIAAGQKTTIILHKPAGYVVSRNGQGSPTIYELLPPGYHRLKPVGRLDKDSSGLLLLTSDGSLANQLTHPSHHKIKVYEVTLDKPLQPLHRQMISEYGLQLEDGPSRLQLDRLPAGAIAKKTGVSAASAITPDTAPDTNTAGTTPDTAPDTAWQVTMHEGRNRQIRRTFAALGYTVTRLHRVRFGNFALDDLPAGKIATP